MPISGGPEIGAPGGGPAFRQIWCFGMCGVTRTRSALWTLGSWPEGRLSPLPGAVIYRRLRARRGGLVAGARKARVMKGTSSLITASVLPGSQRPFENAKIRCGPAAV